MMMRMRAATKDRYPAGSKGQYHSIQALRFLAAFAVVVLHSSFYTFERLDNSLGIYASGANGVRLFFVISGFVMIMSSVELQTLPRGWSVFAAKRIIRIVPLYWFATSLKLIALLSVPVVILHAEMDWVYIAQSYLFIPAYNIDGEMHPLLGVGWTLIFEMFFYLLFTLALLLRVDPLRFIAPILIGLSMLALFKTKQWPVALQFWADPIVLDFMAGMLIARWHLAGGSLGWRASLLAVALGAAYLFVPFPKLDYLSLVGSLVITLAAALVIVGAISIDDCIGHRIPRAVLFMGAASYAIYLMHPLAAPASPAILAKIGSPWPFVAVCFSITIALAVGTLCHSSVERPLTRVINNWARKQGLFDEGRTVHACARSSDVEIERVFSARLRKGRVE